MVFHFDRERTILGSIFTPAGQEEFTLSELDRMNHMNELLDEIPRRRSRDLVYLDPASCLLVLLLCGVLPHC